MAETAGPAEAKAKSESKSGGVNYKTNKIFVGGISWTTTDDGFHKFFSKYGEITDCIVMRDKVTKTSRGFGFVTFKDGEPIGKILNQTLELDGRVLDCKPAVPKDEIEQNGPPPVQKTRKIFVGGVSQDTTEPEFRAFFEKFGTVVEAKIMTDGMTGRPRGFGFVTFDNEDPVEAITQKHHLELNGKQVECKKAVPKARIEGNSKPGTAQGYGQSGSGSSRGGYTTTSYGGGGGGGGYGQGRGYGGYDYGSRYDYGGYGGEYGKEYGYRGYRRPPPARPVAPKPNPEYTTTYTPAFQSVQQRQSAYSRGYPSSAPAAVPMDGPPPKAAGYPEYGAATYGGYGTGGGYGRGASRYDRSFHPYS
ncbi:hypothetical protein AAMO2058_000300600 [Amorphochlora amoebiformis]|uniref:RRM domain-containing protein n=1 Tax=Amorphochlora amoebiformis TaxID=1561963 RepID=A0A7S0GVQ1_9EUKA|mmetsp:Transcript_22665/g.35592  ORF Transcript_22665/g.35592 Transcript_22665/m.35592 type:complete len:362 (+) Transcript_22665:18-1103(+)